MGLFAQCGSTNMDKAAPVSISNPYYQKWVAGRQGGGEGILIIIPVNGELKTPLKSAYFQGKKIPLTYMPNENRYEGRWTDPSSVDKDMVMSDDANEEYQNKLPQVQEQIPFELQEGECIISYMKSGKPGFFKIDQLKEKDLMAMPSARPKQ